MSNRLLLPDFSSLDEAQLWALNEQLIESWHCDELNEKQAQQLEDAIIRIEKLLKKKIEGF